MTNEEQLLIAALAQAVAGKPLQLPEQIDWALFVNQTLMHSVTALVYDGLQRGDALSAVPEKYQTVLAQKYFTAIYREAQLEHTKNRLSEKMLAAKIPHIFLKGICLKNDYPVPSLRTMCDIDALVHAEDFEALDTVARELGAESEHGDGNHRNYSFPNGVNLEFHPNLVHHDSPVCAGINPGWQYAKEDPATGAWEMTEEGFYLNTLCHLADHFASGGVGVRFVLDVWVCRNLRKAQPDRAFVEAELKRLGLLDFAVNIENLADSWFGNGEMTPVLEELAEYILTSRSHGHSERAMLNAVAISGSQSAAIMKKTFHSRAEMEDRFPWVKGKPWLLPVAWCVRAFKAVTKRGRLVTKWIKGTGNIEKDEIRRQREMLKRFGICPQKKR